MAAGVDEQENVYDTPLDEALTITSNLVKVP